MEFCHRTLKQALKEDTFTPEMRSVSVRIDLPYMLVHLSRRWGIFRQIVEGLSLRGSVRL